MWKFSPKILFFFASLLIVNAAKLECEYETKDEYRGTEGLSVYNCDAFKPGIFTDERVTIDSVEGEHEEGRTNRDVNGVVIRMSLWINYFPRNMENIFGDLEEISIYACRLKEIKQQDIKAFNKLKFLDLSNNKITKLDADLFEFNPELRIINLSVNEISHIDPHVFDHLNHLTEITLNNNKCKDENTMQDGFDRSGVLTVMQQVNDGYCV